MQPPLEQPLTIHMYISKQGDCLCVDNNILPKPAIIDSPGLGPEKYTAPLRLFTTQPVTIHEDGVKFTVFAVAGLKRNCQMIRLAIIEDELPAANRLKRLLGDCEIKTEVVAHCDSAARQNLPG